MPLDFTGLRETLLQAKRKQQPTAAPVTPEPIPQQPPAEIPAPPTVFKAPEASPPVFSPQPRMQPVGDIDGARAPRFDQIDPKLIGGGKLQSEEELADLRSKGLVRPQNNFSFGDRLKSALKTALPGLAQGGIGGAIAGAVGGAIDPRQGRRYQFETFQQPSIDAARKRQIDEEAIQANRAAVERAAAKANLDEQEALMNLDYKRGQIAGMPSADEARAEREADLAYKQAQTKALGAKPPAPYLSTKAGVFDPSTRQIIEGTAPPEPQIPYTERYQTELGNVTDEWGDPREVATSSTNARKESIIDSLPDQYKSVLRTGKRLNGSDASAKDMTEAQEAFNKARERDIDEGERVDRRKREVEARRRAAGDRRRPQGQGSGRSGRTAISLEEAAKLLQ